MTARVVHLPAPVDPYRCRGAGVLPCGVRCLGCADCYRPEPDDAIEDVPSWGRR